MANLTNGRPVPDQIYFLSEILGSPVLLNGRRIGKLVDFAILDRDRVAEVTHLYVVRPFGDKALLVPWDKIASFERGDVRLAIEGTAAYETPVEEKTVMLQDEILDKKVLDVKDREVEVVYDVKLLLRNGRLYVTDVDLSRSGLLRRLGFKWLANLVYYLAESIRKQTVPWNYVEPLPEHISSFQGNIRLKVLKEELADMPPVDLADILEEMDHEQRVAVFHELEPEQASDTLEEMDPNVQRDLIASLEKEKAAQLINEMTPGQAADILSVLPWWEVEAISKLLNTEHAIKIKSILEQQEEKIANFATTGYMKLTPEKTVLQARRGYQRVARGKDVIMYLYIVDENDKLVGVIDFKELLRSNDEDLLKNIMITRVIALKPDSTLKEASVMFARYGFRALPITDENDRMIGVIPYRDVMNLKHLFV